MTLKATARQAGENLAKLRASGLVPAVVYGAGRTTESISVSQKELIKVWKEAGESGTVTLELPSGKATVLIHEIVNDPSRDIPQHVDFLAIDVSKPIQVSIPLEFSGTAPAVKNGLGTLVKNMHEVEVKGLAKDIPHSVEVDLSVLETLENHILVKDLKLPSGVETLVDAEAIVANIATIKEEKEAAPIDFSQIEVEKKGKKEEEAAAE